ncbi:MAG: hypothetical protein LBL33_06260 [Tannerella sp.]|nr:hypothetical protein [Tannerella sp.]
MSKKATPPAEQLLHSLLRIHVPSSYRVGGARNPMPQKYNTWCTGRGKRAVLDGFCNPLNILTRSFSLKRIYLIIKRRRWKEAGSDNHYSK